MRVQAYWDLAPAWQTIDEVLECGGYWAGGIANCFVFFAPQDTFCVYWFMLMSSLDSARSDFTFYLFFKLLITQAESTATEMARLLCRVSNDEVPGHSIKPTCSARKLV